MYRRVVGSAVALALAACGSAAVKPPPDSIVKQWSEAMTVYNINPIYPHTQDVHVGDIYAFRLDSDAQFGNLFRAVKLDYVSMQKELDEHYGDRPVFPATGTAPAAGGIWSEPAIGIGTPKAEVDSGVGKSDLAKKPAAIKSKAIPAKQPAAAATTSIFQPVGYLTQLPLVAFPAMELAHVDVEALGASVPLHFFDAVFGASRRAEGSLRIQIKAGLTYGVPIVPAANALREYCWDGRGQSACLGGFDRWPHPID